MNYGEVIVLCASAVTLLGAVFNLIKNNSISNKAVDSTENAEKALSAEHKELKAKQDIVLERTADAKTMTQKMQETLSATERLLFEAEAKQRANYQALPDAQRQLVDGAATVGKFAAEFAKLAADNAALRQEIKELNQRLQANERTRGGNRTPKREADDYGMEP